MTDDDLDRTVTAKINSDAVLASYKIDVDADADKNTVTLSGSVPSESLRMRAVDDAKAANAGLVVTDKIDVKPGDVDRSSYNEDMAREARERASKAEESIGDTLDDAWIHTKLRSKLLAEGEFPGGSLKIDVKDNVVTLRGSVSTKEDKAKAEQIAKNTDGVKSVRNQVVIKPKT
jgi:hyperosmotically inducible protein